MDYKVFCANKMTKVKKYILCKDLFLNSIHLKEGILLIRESSGLNGSFTLLECPSLVQVVAFKYGQHYKIEWQSCP